MNQTLRKEEQNQVPEKVNEVVNDYFKVVEERLPNLLESFYLFGSVSLGAYQDGMSDIDFYAVVKRKLTDADVEVLKQVHHDMKKKYPKPSLDGCMLQERISTAGTKAFSHVRILMKESFRCFVLFTATRSMRTSLKRTAL
jgi:Nucleotidyltransferase domain